MDLKALVLLPGCINTGYTLQLQVPMVKKCWRKMDGRGVYFIILIHRHYNALSETAMTLLCYR
jgi:hypothetical protein